MVLKKDKKEVIWQAYQEALTVGQEADSRVRRLVRLITAISHNDEHLGSLSDDKGYKCVARGSYMRKHFAAAIKIIRATENATLLHTRRYIRIIDLGGGWGSAFLQVPDNQKCEFVSVEFREQYRKIFKKLYPPKGFSSVKHQFIRKDLTTMTPEWLLKLNADIIYMYQPLENHNDMLNLYEMVTTHFEGTIIGFMPTGEKAGLWKSLGEAAPEAHIRRSYDVKPY